MKKPHIPNTSAAVMNRRQEPPNGLDYFPTPPWATRALLERLGGKAALKKLRAWEPAAGEGHMARPMREYFRTVRATDVFDYGFCNTQDFLCDWPGREEHSKNIDWIITNPPFNAALQFVALGLKRAPNVAVLVRTNFLESKERYHDIFARNPPAFIFQFVERVIMAKGVLRDPSLQYYDAAAEKMRFPGTATAYCWLVWNRGATGPTVFDWLEPCRPALTRPGDYPLPEPETGLGPLFEETEASK